MPRCKAAVGEDGTAYRIGGDEFCLLLTCAESRFDAVARAAAAALAESDRGVEVGSSWGAATIPAEAGDPSSALQLADVRMYAQKESRRTLRTEVGESRSGEIDASRPGGKVEPPLTGPTVRVTRG